MLGNLDDEHANVNAIVEHSPLLKKGKKKVVITYKKEGCNTRTSQRVTQASTTLAQARLTAEF